MATTLDAPPAVPAASVPLTDEAWRDYHTKMQRYVAQLAQGTTALQTGAAAAASAWQTASGQPAATTTTTGS